MTSDNSNMYLYRLLALCHYWTLSTSIIVSHIMMRNKYMLEKISIFTNIYKALVLVNNTADILHLFSIPSINNLLSNRSVEDFRSNIVRLNSTIVILTL